MKYLFTILFAFLFMACIHGQGYQIITSVDTLQSGDVIVTQTDINGNIIDKGLAKPGFVFENDTSEFVYTPPPTPDNTGDVFVDNIDMPGVDGGFLPQDIVFNPHNGNYYIYGYRKVLVCDVDLNVILTLEISNLDNFSGFYSDYHQQMICVHPDVNKVYCLTLEGVLVEIDQYYNVTELTSAISCALVEKGSMIFKKISSNNYVICYYLNYIDQNNAMKTSLFKYVPGGSLNSVVINAGIAYDLDMIPVFNGYRIFVSTESGIEIYSDQLAYISTTQLSLSFDHIEVLNNLLFVHEQGEPELWVLNTSGNAVQNNVDGISYEDIRFMQVDENNDKIYLSGYRSLSSGIDIVALSQGTYSYYSNITTGTEAMFGLAKNNSYIVACGELNVLYINLTDQSFTTNACNSMGIMYRIAVNDSQDIKSCAIQPLNGNAIAFAPAQSAVLDIGGQVSALCIKDDKVFAAVHKYNQDGYILVLNASSGMIIDKIQPNFDFNPVDIFCANDPEIDNDRVYVVYFDMDDQTKISRLMFFDFESYQITEPQPPVYFDGGLLEYLITPNETVCFGVKVGDACPPGAYMYIYDYELIQKENPFFALQGCAEEFDYFSYGVNNYIVWVSRCNNSVYFFSDVINNVGLEKTIDSFDHPFAFAFDPVSELCYCKDSDNDRIYTIDPSSNFNKTTHDELDFYGELIHELLFNPNDGYIYAISENVIFQMDSPGSISNEYGFPDKYICDMEKHRDDDFVFDAVSNVAYFPTYATDGFYEKSLIMAFSFENGFSSIEGKYCKVSDKASQINAYQGLGKHATYFQEKENLFEASMLFSNTSIITTHEYPRHLTGNWDWISFPCMPRLGNEGYNSKAVLENIEDLEDFSLLTFDGTYNLELTYEYPNWDIDDIPKLYSTIGYKYNSDAIVTQDLAVNGLVLDPSTPIPLSSQYDNWIGYFLEFPLMPEDAFVGIWNKLTRITTKDWTMFKYNGQWYASSRITPIEYGDGFIVTVSDDCELVWNYALGPAESYEYPETEYFSYSEKAEYTPFYFVMDSLDGISEIGLMVNDSCVGAAVVEPGDSIVEVNAYLTGVPSGVPIEVETFSGFKSARLGSENYSVVDLPTKKRVSRQVYTGEHRPYYVISFKAGETAVEEDIVILQPPAPNPFNSSCSLSFVLKRYAGISLTVHDLRGKQVAKLMQGAYPEGLYEAAWTGKDYSGNKMENGIYLIRLTVDERIVENEKVVLIR